MDQKRRCQFCGSCFGAERVPRGEIRHGLIAVIAEHHDSTVVHKKVLHAAPPAITS
jgi:hypothetical protein